MSPRAGPGQEATDREVAEGGQAGVLRGAGGACEAGRPDTGPLCVPQSRGARKGGH